jgi:hypothetical protein
MGSEGFFSRQTGSFSRVRFRREILSSTFCFTNTAKSQVQITEPPQLVSIVCVQKNPSCVVQESKDWWQKVKIGEETWLTV